MACTAVSRSPWSVGHEERAFDGSSVETPRPADREALCETAQGNWAKQKSGMGPASPPATTPTAAATSTKRPGTGEEAEALEEANVDAGTAAQTLVELEAEIVILRDLEQRAVRLKLSGHGAKWRQLKSILDEPMMVAVSEPVPTTINFHRSTDERGALNLGTWTSFEQFTALLDRSNFCRSAAAFEIWRSSTRSIST